MRPSFLRTANPWSAPSTTCAPGGTPKGSRPPCTTRTGTAGSASSASRLRPFGATSGKASASTPAAPVAVAVRQATRAPALRPPTTSTSRSSVAQHRQPGGVQPRRGLRHPAPGHPPGLLHPGHPPAQGERGVARGEQVGGVDPAAGPVTEHQQPAGNPLEVHPGRTRRRRAGAGVLHTGHGRAVSSSRAPAPALLPDAGSAYWRFYDRVAAAQVAAWAPAAPSRVLDLSGERSLFAGQLVLAGHEVVQVRERVEELELSHEGPGRVVPVLADRRSLAFLADGSVDAVLAEGRALSMCLATEVTASDLSRVLRPGGRLLLVVDSLTTGLARLAGQGRWAELADVPQADVVLVPAEADDPDGGITRCFFPGEVTALLDAVGLEVEWVRPRSVLSPAAVERAVEQGGEAALATLVRSELTLAAEREGEAGGLHLVASARRPA